MHNASMSEKELLTDLLNSEKTLVKDYASNCTETACSKLRNVLLDCMTECASDQFAVFEQMSSRNMYKTKPAKPQDVQTAKQDMDTLLQETW